PLGEPAGGGGPEFRFGETFHAAGAGHAVRGARARLRGGADGGRHMTRNDLIAYIGNQHQRSTGAVLPRGFNVGERLGALYTLELQAPPMTSLQGRVLRGTVLPDVDHAVGQSMAAPVQERGQQQVERES